MKNPWWILILFALLACSQKEHAGTTSETENEIAVRVLSKDGLPVASAKVFLVDLSHYDSLIALGKNAHLDSAWTDAEGRANLMYRGDSVIVNLLAQKEGFAGLIRGYQSQDSVLTLEASSRVSGKTNLPAGSRVVLDGTGLSAEIGADGGFQLDDAPQGYFALLLQPKGEEAFFSKAIALDSTPKNLQGLQADGFLLEDFEDGDSIPLIEAFGAGAAWYVYRDGEGTIFEPSNVFTQITQAITEVDSVHGKVLSLKVILDSSGTDAYGSLACKLGRSVGEGRVNLSELDSITFWIKGLGQVRIAFASDFIHTRYPVTQAYADLGYNFQVPQEWTKITVSVDKLTPPENSEPWADGVVWNDVASAIDLLVIGTWDDSGQTVAFSIDDIRFHGISHTIFR